MSESEVARDFIAEKPKATTKGRPKGRPKGLSFVREYSARTLCFSLANELKKEAFVKVPLRVSLRHV